MQKNRPVGKRQMKANEVDDGGLLRRNFIDYLWRHLNQGSPRTLDELFDLVNASYKEKGRSPMGRGEFVKRMHTLDTKKHVKSEMRGGKIVFRAIRRPEVSDLLALG